jgi:lipopolysaccharide export system permease protein
MIFKYIAYHYIKNLLIILLGLAGLFAGLDFLMNALKLSSFNVRILYIFFKVEEALAILFPLAIVFAGIWTKISFIKQNKLVSLYSLGLTRKEFFKPFLMIGFSTYFLFLVLHFTSFSHARDDARELLQNSYDISKTHDLFFKYNDSFVYIGALIPQKYKIEDLTIFQLEGSQVVETITAKEAWYNIHEWVASNAIRREIVNDEEGKQRLKVEKVRLLKTLQEYQPEILKSIYDGRSLTLYENIMAVRLLSKQGLETHGLRAGIYQRVVTPLFSISLLMILMFNVPFHARYMNLTVSTTKAIGGTLVVWGILFLFHRIAQNGVLNPELVMILPISLLWMYAFYSLVQSQKRI